MLQNTRASLSKTISELQHELRDLLSSLDSTTRIQSSIYTHLFRYAYILSLEGFAVLPPFLSREETLNTAQSWLTNTPHPPKTFLLFEQQLNTIYTTLARELPTLFAPQLNTQCIPLPPAGHTCLIKHLNQPNLTPCWQDDMTLGWMYELWNSQSKAVIDAKVYKGNKIDLGDIASKTQLFTERYMVEWILHNTLNAKWLW